AVLFGGVIGGARGRILGQQFAIEPVNLPRLLIVYFAPRALAIGVVGVILPLVIGPCLRHWVLSVVDAVSRTRVTIASEVSSRVVTHAALIFGQRQITRRQQSIVDGKTAGLEHRFVQRRVRWVSRISNPRISRIQVAVAQRVIVVLLLPIKGRVAGVFMHSFQPVQGIVIVLLIPTGRTGNLIVRRNIHFLF